MADDISQIRADIGDLREDNGYIKGQLKGIDVTLSRLERTIASHQSVNLAAHSRHDAAIADVTHKLATKLGEETHSNRLTERLWGLAGGGIGGALMGYVISWLTGGAKPPGHPL